MTAEDQKLIHTFEARVRSLLLKMGKMQEEADELFAMVEERDNRIKELEGKLGQVTQKYDSLKTARILTLSDDDMHQAKSRISALIREVDLCIAQLNAQE